MTYEWASRLFTSEEILSDLTLKDVNLGDTVNVLFSQIYVSGLLANTDVCILFRRHTHSVHDFLVGREVASIAGGASGIKVLMERDSPKLTVGWE